MLASLRAGALWRRVRFSFYPRALGLSCEALQETLQTKSRSLQSDPLNSDGPNLKLCSRVFLSDCRGSARSARTLTCLRSAEKLSSAFFWSSTAVLMPCDLVFSSAACPLRHCSCARTTQNSKESAGRKCVALAAVPRELRFPATGSPCVCISV